MIRPSDSMTRARIPHAPPIGSSAPAAGSG